MAINSDIRDQAYQFFVEEAPELLQAIESGLLALHQERSTSQIHNLMRSAHSIKGGAASVGLETIATIAHRLENIFKALYSDTLELNTYLEDQLLRAYDCLRLPLMEQIMTGTFNAEHALAIANPIFNQLEEDCGDAIIQTETYIPTSADLGIDMVASIFEVDVAEGLNRLIAVLANPEAREVAGELRAQIEVFAGFAELLNLPGFGAIAEMAGQALDAHPDRALEITQLALVDFEASRQAVLAGDRTSFPSASSALNTLADSLASPTLSVSDVRSDPTSDITLNPPFELVLDISLNSNPTLDVESITAVTGMSDNLEASSLLDNLEDIFGGAFTVANQDIDLMTADETAAQEQSLAGTTDQWQEIQTNLPTRQITSKNINSKSIVLRESFLPEDIGSEQSILDQITAIEIHPEDITSSSVRYTISNVDLTFEEQIDQADLTEISLEPIDVEWVVHSPTTDADRLVPLQPNSGSTLQIRESTELSYLNPNQLSWPSKATSQTEAPAIANLTVRVESSRLEKMNNLVSELAINRDALSLQNDQLQGVTRELLDRFARFQNMVEQLREVSDKMLVDPERYHQSQGTAGDDSRNRTVKNGDRPFIFSDQTTFLSTATTEFDSLELDSYGALHPQIQEILENMVQLEETVDDITLFSRQSNQMLDQQRNRLSQLQDELIWARMLPLGEVLNRFPRILRDLSTTYGKPVQLQLTGTSVLIEKAILEKLHDPLLHLLRNAFDHGIERPSLRQECGKPEQGQIEIRAYHKGNQTIIEVKDDGQGLSLERIRSRAFDLGLLSLEQLATIPTARLLELIFEPGFSTADRVSELSGRGVGLDVVRSQLRSVKGKVAVTSVPGAGTTFTLYLPLTMTITKLIICLVNSTALALPADNVEEILTPQVGQIKQSGTQQLLYWREQLIPTYRLSDLLIYSCPQPATLTSKALIAAPVPQNWALPMLILRQEQQFFALEVDRLVTEQELVIKPFGTAIAAPNYTYGCTTLGDGSLVPVIDGTALLSFNLEQAIATIASLQQSGVSSPPVPQAIQTPTILVVDDAATLRRSLALSLERVGFRVLQARDGREAIDQFRHSSALTLVVCDVEMPNMNGFEFLSYRRQDPELLKVPIVMLTSRSHEKHRWLATQLGATAYFTKPYLEQEFLEAIAQIINEGKLA
jgi:two-component system, chemotaxis family, sensor histidine kinase and response regulator PixL